MKTIISLSFGILLGCSLLAGAQEKDTLSPYVDAKGNIALPDDFRLSHQHLGSWFVPDGGTSGFHDVFIEADAIRHYRKNGVFPDGTTIIKELRGSLADDYTTGQGVHRSTTEVKQWFVMVKDSSNRFSAINPIWGDGWGWALFKPDNVEQNLSSNYKKDCYGCHVPAKENDWLYVEAYPTLSEPQ